MSRNKSKSQIKMEEDNKQILEEIKEEVEMLRKDVQSIKKTLQEHRHDGHGYAT